MITEFDFNLASGSNSWRRVGDLHPIDLYYGKDNKGRNAIEYKGKFMVNSKIHSSVLIEIVHYKNGDGSKSIVFSLLDNKFLKPFCDFLNVMIDATCHSSLSNQEAYYAICEVYFIMQKMFRTNSEILSEPEIKGLIGELLFIRDFLLPKMPVTKAIGAWGGAEKNRKDFAFDLEWYEVKTIDFGKETVRISSIEQLDSPVEGTLVVYQLERMTEEYVGVTLNKLVGEIMKIITSVNDKDILVSKLRDVGYTYHPKYDEYVYELRTVDEYNVNSEFPRISRENIPVAIAKASFDLILSEISSYKK